MKYLILTTIIVGLVVYLTLRGTTEETATVEVVEKPAVLAAPLMQPPPAPAPVKAKPQGNARPVPPVPLEEIPALEARLRANPKDAEALLALGNHYLKNPATRDKAADLLRRALEINPEDKDTLEKFLASQQNSGKPGGPLEALRKLAEENPDSPNIAGALARTMASKGNYEDAIGLLERSLEANKGEPFAYHSLMEMYRRAGQPERAVSFLEQNLEKQQSALQQTPGAQNERNLFIAQGMLVEALLDSGQRDRAQAILNAMATSQPDAQRVKELQARLQGA